jgi:hypothetical protein
MANTTDRYSSNPSDSNVRMEERIRALERQVSDLQAGRGIRRALVSSGRVRIANDAGTEVARIGEGVWGSVGGTSETTMIAILGDDGAYRFLATTDDGLVWPPARNPWINLLPMSGTAVPVTAGTWTSTHRVIYYQSADSVRARITIGVDAATTGELRLESAGPYQTLVLPLAAGSLTDYRFDWWIGPGGVGWALGTELSIDIQVQRTSGAGAINVHFPAPLMVTDHRVIRASESGEAVP